MGYTKNPKFAAGNVLSAEDLQNLEQALIDSKNDWDISDENQDSFIKNRPLYKDTSGYLSWGGGGSAIASLVMKQNFTNHTYNCIYLEQKVTISNAEWIIGGTITVASRDNTTTTKVIGPYCRTLAECFAAKLQYVPGTTDRYDIIIVKGTIFNLSSQISVIMYVDGANIRNWKPLAFIAADVSTLTPLNENVELKVGIYVPDFANTSSLQYRLKDLTYIDITVNEDYKNFFNSFSYPIHVLEVASLEDIENQMALFKPGDIILAIPPSI